MDKTKQDAFLILRVSHSWKTQLIKRAEQARVSLSEYIRAQLYRIESLDGE